MRKVLLGIVVGLTFAGAASADEWVVEAHFTDQAALQRAARHFDHVIVDRKRNMLRVETTGKGIEALEAEGLAVTVDTAATARLEAANARVAAVRDRLAREGKSTVVNGSGYDSIPGYECFRTVEGTYATMDDLVTAHPDIASIDDIGPTWKKTQDSTQGYEMRAMHITNLATLPGDPDRPKFAAYFSIHAREYTPAEIGTRFSEWLVNNYGTDPEATWLVDHNDFHLIVMANPDARKEAEQQIYHRKNLDDAYGDVNQCGDDEFSQFGVDLNRNFPFHWNITLGQGSDDDSCSQTYHGPYLTGSNHQQHIQGDPEPETVNLFGYVGGTCAADGTCSGGLFADRRTGTTDPIDCNGTGNCDDGGAAPADTSGVFVDMHSNASLVLWPWGDTSNDSPNVTDLTTFGRRIAWFNGYTPEQSNELYFTDGTTDDSMYGLLGVASYTIETNGFDFFEDCATFESNTAPTNLEALRYISRSLHAPYQLPAGPDTVDVEISTDLVVPGDTVAVTAHIDSSRFNQSNGTQTVNNIANAGLYVDVLPWDTDAVQPMDPTDGAFDSPVETATANIVAGWRGSALRLRAGRRRRGALGYAERGVLRRRRCEPDRHYQRHRHRPRDERSAEREHRAAQPRQQRVAHGDQRSDHGRVRSACVPRHVRRHGHRAAPHRADAERHRARGRLDADAELLDARGLRLLRRRRRERQHALDRAGTVGHRLERARQHDARLEHAELRRRHRSQPDDGRFVRPHRLQRRDARFRRPLRHRIGLRFRLRRVQREWRQLVDAAVFVLGPVDVAIASSRAAVIGRQRVGAQGPLPPE